MVLWEIINYILKKKEEKEPEEWEKEYYEEAKKAEGVEPLDIEALVLLRKTKKLAETIERDYQKAVKTLREKRDEIKDPAIRALIDVLLEDIPNRYGTKKKSIWASKGYMIPTIIAAEAIEKGKHKDLRTFMEYLIGKTKALSEELIKELEGLDEQKIDRLVKKRVIEDYPEIEHLLTYVDPNHTLYMIKEAIWKGPIKKVYTGQTKNPTYKYLYALYETLPRYQEVIARDTVLRTIRENREKMYQEIKDDANFWLKERLGIDIDFLDKSLEEWEEEEAEEEEKPELGPEGVRILAEPERYLALTTKILLLLKTLEWRTRRGNRIPRQVYQALRNILETPLLTGNYPHTILPLIERYEKGETPNPLQHILETITQTAENNLTTQIRKTLEKMKPIMEKINRGTPLTPEEKQALNNHIRELQKTLLQAKPEEILEAYHAILLTTQNPSHEEALKTIDGILEDLRQVYTGEKTKQQLDRERDITQIINIYHNLKNVEERAPLYPDQVAELIRTTITENIDDPLTRELYKQAIQHYEQTHQYVTEKPETLLQRLEEKENQLLQALKERAREEPRITRQVMASIRNFYRTLILTTPRPTIKETIEFYEKIKPLLKHKTPLGEYTPIHGPVTADLLNLHNLLLEKKGEEREGFVRTAGSIASAAVMSSLAMRETAKQILARRQGEEIPIKDHKRFIKQLEYHQVRK